MSKATNRTPLARMRVIAQKLTSGHGFTLASLAKELNVCKDTVHKDLNYLRDFMGYDIQFDAAGQSFVGTAPKERVL